MPTIKTRVSVPLNGVVDNALAGNQFEFLPYNAMLEFGVVAAATGVLMDIFSGGDTLIEAGSVSPANRSPLYPDDFEITDVAAAGERIKVRLRNTTAGAINVDVVCRITPA